MASAALVPPCLLALALPLRPQQRRCACAVHGDSPPPPLCGSFACSNPALVPHQFEEEELAVASQLLRSEAEHVRKAMAHGDLGPAGGAAALRSGRPRARCAGRSGVGGCCMASCALSVLGSH